MNRKQKVDLITATSLIIIGSIVLIVPMFGAINVKYVFMFVLVFYGIINLIQYVLTNKEKDIEGLLTMFASIITTLVLGFIDVNTKPINLALTLFLWISLMSFIKLKKIDYYHDRSRKIWILKIVTLVLFILIGLLSVLNLYYESTVQIIVLGFFYFIHGVIELVDPITDYLIDNSKK